MRDKSKVKIKIKHIPQGYAVRHLASWAAFNNLHTQTMSAHLPGCVCVCVLVWVCVFCIILLANCPCTWCNSVAHLPLQTRLNPTCAWVPVAFAASVASVAFLLSCVCVVCSNLIWNFCAIQQNMAKIWQRTQYEKVLWGKLRINVFNNSRNGRWSHNKSQLPLLLLSLLYFVWKRATVMAGKHNGTSAGVITHWEYPESSCKSDCFLTSCKAVDAKKNCCLLLGDAWK